MKLLFWLFYLPLLVVVAAFAVANRQAIEINLAPFPFGLTAPVFAIVLSAILVGLIVGGTSAWFSRRKWRRNARKLSRQNSLLEAEITSLREKADTRQIAISAISDDFPVAPAVKQSRSAVAAAHEPTR